VKPQVAVVAPDDDPPADSSPRPVPLPTGLVGVEGLQDPGAVAGGAHDQLAEAIHALHGVDDATVGHGHDDGGALMGQSSAYHVPNKPNG
jgi:hypothetical protein